MNKVLTEREEEVLDTAPRAPANDARAEGESGAWSGRRKTAVASD